MKTKLFNFGIIQVNLFQLKKVFNWMLRLDGFEFNLFTFLFDQA